MLFSNVTDAVAIASRIFALYFVIQAVIAVTLAGRARAWLSAVGFGVVAIVMAVIAVFGLPI